MKPLAKIIASGFGTGYAPIAPGTAGSILATAIVYVFVYHLHFNQFDLNAFLLTMSSLGFVIGIGCCNLLEDEWGKDPSKVVWDEMIGIFISLIFIPITFTNLILSLILFRFFDISKILGIRKLEDIDGGAGVMLDDVLAGVYANLVLQAIIYFKVF